MQSETLDPMFDAILAPLRAWATVVWEAKPEEIRRMAVVLKEAIEAAARGDYLDARPPGPGVAVMQTLRRIVRKAKNFRTLEMPDGQQLQLHLDCPKTVE